MINNFFEKLPYFISTIIFSYSLWTSNLIYMLIFLTNTTIFALTSVLKRMIKQERPNKRSLYGMPSGHCTYFFSFSTLLYYLSDQYIFFASLALSIIVAYQRIISQNHTKKQVIVGILFGYSTTFLIYKFIILYLINVKL